MEDGLLLNFEIGDAALLPRPKFKGGSWRDQASAKRAIKRDLDSTVTPVASQDRTGNQSGPAVEDQIENATPDHRIKRRRTGPPKALSQQQASPRNSVFRPGGITSRLFTYNPEPRTSFDVVQKPDGSISPSNAPINTATFAGLGISNRMQSFLSDKLDLTTPTGIQKSVIPHLLSNVDQDVFIQAQTGSGKTLAYLLPVLQRIISITVAPDGSSVHNQRIHRNSGIFAIILAPTRELAKQIDAVLSKLLQCAPWIVCTTVTGGEKKKAEKARIRKGSNILIGTPGRMSDHINNTKVLDEQFGTTRWLILDEGDRLMEMGFEDDIRTIIAKIQQAKLITATRDNIALDMLPKRRVAVLCSATLKSNVQKLGEMSLQDAKHLSATSDEEAAVSAEHVFEAPSQLKQIYAIVPAKTRLVTLISLLKSTFARRGSVMKAIIFLSCADSVNFHYSLLKTKKVVEEETGRQADRPPNSESVDQAAYFTSPACPEIRLCKLHGSLPQPVRTATLTAFKASKQPAVLVTTDISSRGLDVPEVELVVEYDPAFSMADHVHRIGRTARAGRVGKAVLFLLPGCEEGYAKILPQTPVPVPQHGDAMLQKGLEIGGITFPVDTEAKPPPEKSFRAQAEALQLHIEQRLLLDKELLDAGRAAFRSHIRAYATHVKDERQYFDITELHLGHMAKSFGLREPPSGVGLGVRQGSRKSAGKTGKSGNNGHGDGDDEAGDTAPDMESMARRMKTKMNLVMNAANEFNIG